MSAGASSYLLRSIGKLGCVGGCRVLDLGCGAGRHTVLLSQLGHDVIGLDLDAGRLALLAQRLASTPSKSTALLVRADARRPIPFVENAFDLVVVVHLIAPGLMARLAPVLRSGGHVILETFGGQGENWRDLPCAGQIRAEMDGLFDPLDYRERGVGPTRSEAVAIKLMARRR